MIHGHLSYTRISTMLTDVTQALWLGITRHGDATGAVSVHIDAISLGIAALVVVRTESSCITQRHAAG